MHTLCHSVVDWCGGCLYNIMNMLKHMFIYICMSLEAVSRTYHRVCVCDQATLTCFLKWLYQLIVITFSSIDKFNR